MDGAVHILGMAAGKPGKLRDVGEGGGARPVPGLWMTPESAHAVPCRTIRLGGAGAK
ncbi:protein of unknown function [Azospirillum lipoferum 4B]|uniref:Uncharacterized protein n=1 Tax=Azospirillum lipoferum (strain 4B) TaxID=862719 RepID=G7Z8M2_AZOL4|nr:protein of unknown function [Azospirillum lipoferum 4B]